MIAYKTYSLIQETKLPKILSVSKQMIMVTVFILPSCIVTRHCDSSRWNFNL